MEKSIVIWALLLIVGISNTFANNTDSGVNDRVINSFRKDFAAAENVQWEAGKAYVKATFKLGGQVVFAYYSESGDLLAVSRNITSGQLPISLLAELKKKYSNYWITDLFELSKNSDTSYYITLEDADHVVVLHSSSTYGWEVYRRDKKVLAD